MHEWENLPAETRAAFGRAVLESMFPNHLPGIPLNPEVLARGVFDAAKSVFAQCGAPEEFWLAEFSASQTVFGGHPNRVTWTGSEGFALGEGCTLAFAEAFRRTANA